MLWQECPQDLVQHLTVFQPSSGAEADCTRLFLFLFLLPSLALPAPTLFLSFYPFPPLTPPNLYDFSSSPYPLSFTPSFTFLPVKLTLLEMPPPRVDGYVTRTLI
ncbi:hypothetical protein RRG08_044275 [Elysia crispata]|uniref:Uncharacterized protein n=1 Tax=Elysia crispata TaxID=231223 RepID=A0AAE0XWU9_9GAST|nr:hypothetical protein RRG08_044275 [Elysia crispata]